MLQELARYLFQYKYVAIPGIGSFELNYQSAFFDVTRKLISPPFYATQFSKKDVVKEHQIQFLAANLKTDGLSAQHQLQEFGSELKSRIQHEILYWKGVGKLEHRNAQILFQPENLSTGLAPIPAEKIIRSNALHKVLIGEREFEKSHVQDPTTTAARKTNYAVLIGWLLLVVAAIAIFLLLYTGKFDITTTGNKMRIKPQLSTGK